MSKSLLLLPVLLLALSGCGSNATPEGGATASSKQYTLRLKPTGGPITYDLEVDLTADVKDAPNVTDEMKKEDQKAKLKGKLTLEVAEEKDGNVRTAYKVEDV